MIILKNKINNLLILKIYLKLLVMLLTQINLLIKYKKPKLIYLNIIYLNICYQQLQ